MLGNDDLTYQRKSTHAQKAKNSVQALITIERAQKLDLLTHLISNLTQSLVVCGPVGIGKSKLLRTLVENNYNDWPICILSASSEELSFEKIQVQLLRFLAQQETSHAASDLSAILSEYDTDNQKVVLVIDDAGLLVPGLISMLIEYANANTCLRLVLSMTHDDLHIKSSSDANIDESHFIELPPLNKKQCMTFLQNLSAQSDSPISFNAVTDVLVDNLYSVTHGIPGKIVAELPRLSEYRSTVRINSRLMMFGVAGLIVAGLALYFYEPEKPTQLEVSSLPAPLLSRKVAEVKIAQPVIGESVAQPERIVTEWKALPEVEEIQVVPSSDNLIKTEQKADSAAQELGIREPNVVPKQQGDQKEKLPLKKDIVAKQTETPTPVKELKAVEEKPPEKKEENIVVSKPLPAKSQKDDDMAWVKAQNSQHYTMQLMVLSQQQAVLDFLKKNAQLGSRLKYIRLNNKQGQYKYVLLYGAFSTSSEADKAKKKLPPQLRNAWVRRFKDLQQQI